MLNYIIWNPDVYLFQIGNWGIRWYSMCWLIGLVGAYFMVRWLFFHQNIAVKTVVIDGKKQEVNVFDPLFLYCFLGILIGARLGHCLFYQPDYFLSSGTHFIEMIVPFKNLPDGSWHFVGYEGLASHGGTLGLMFSLWLYCRKYQVKMWQVLDDIAIATPITACFIRLGNLMNSEIIGKVTVFDSKERYGNLFGGDTWHTGDSTTTPNEYVESFTQYRDNVLGSNISSYKAMLDDLFMMLDWNIANGPNAAKNWTEGISMMTIKNNKMDPRIRFRSKLDTPKSFIAKWSK
mgnify:CR=1 FL=1